MNRLDSLSRRSWLASVAAAPLLGRAGAARGPKSVAAVVTVYRPLSHADVIVGRLLGGWRNDGGPGPALRLASLFIDQPGGSGFGIGLAEEHGVPVVGTIAEAITLGTEGVAVDGVLCIGEHGDYPHDARGQHLYPRRRFFEEVVRTFRDAGRVVPVFNDKHLGPAWDDARWMAETARELGIPFMAGSSLPVTYRKPGLDMPIGADLEAAVAVGYGPIEAYGFHALEAMQAVVERRRGGEVGVRRVSCLRGDAMRRAVVDGPIPGALRDAAIAATPRRPDSDWRDASGDDVALFRLEYEDGFPADVLMLQGFATGFGVAVQPRGGAGPIAAEFELREQPHYPHFAFLVHAVERMIHSGRPSYPVERTLLTSGVLDRLLTSRAEGGRAIETPELAIRYTPADYPHAPEPLIPIDG